ncbi:hypothetical protein M5K25_014922 [Dendrobium thyrsiflorum]|uniref:Uncharacterized protein n=1 Tax=Dendrobium thyrsiflorum TaxID=117978 RepID=A0ABD0UWP8_DENTH
MIHIGISHAIIDDQGDRRKGVGGGQGKGRGWPKAREGMVGAAKGGEGDGEDGSRVERGRGGCGEVE